MSLLGKPSTAQPSPFKLYMEKPLNHCLRKTCKFTTGLASLLASNQSVALLARYYAKVLCNTIAGSAIAQVVRCQLLTVEAWVEYKAVHVAFVIT
jgi:hypothetical protein